MEKDKMLIAITGPLGWYHHIDEDLSEDEEIAWAIAMSMHAEVF